MSAEDFFDHVARTLAEPMPRRRAVRVIGASLAALAVPGVSPRVARAATGGSSDEGPSVCPGRQRCTTLIDPNNWPAGNKHKCCPFPRQQWSCGPDGWTCTDRCAASGKAIGKKMKATWSAERMGGDDPELSAQPKRYQCCIVPDTIPRDGECLPNCRYQYQFGGGVLGPVSCGKTCCPTYQLCVDGECQPCEKYGGHSCQPAKKGAVICCAKGTNCCANNTTTACCGPKQKCRAENVKKATCVCDKSEKKCGPDCCEKGETCCGGKECCAKGETCTPQGCCPKGRAMCMTPKGKPICCGEGEYCFWKVEDGLVPLVGTCKKGCAPGNTAGTQCCGTGFKFNRSKTACVPE